MHSFSRGIRIALIALGFTILAWCMQAYSLIDWEGAVRLGLQNESFSGSEVERALANVERGIALVDIVWMLPITLIALIGIVRKRLYGLIAGMMDFVVCVYFPLCFAFQRWDTHPETVIAALILFAVPSLIGIIILWISRSEFEN